MPQQTKLITKNAFLCYTIQTSLGGTAMKRRRPFSARSHHSMGIKEWRLEVPNNAIRVYKVQVEEPLGEYKMIERRNRAVLNDALDEFRDAMLRSCPRYETHQRKTVENAINDSLSPKQANQFKMNLKNNGGSIEGAIDIGDFPNLISRNWGQVFSQQFRGDMNVQSLLIYHHTSPK